MGNVSLTQGLLHFFLHCGAVIGALAVSGLLGSLNPRWRVALVVVASFAAAFVMHVVTFIVLKQMLGEGMTAEIHRPVVGVVWGLTSGLTCWLLLNRNPLVLWSGAFLSVCSYFIFVLLRPLLP